MNAATKPAPKYTAGQKQIWRTTHKDARSGNTRAGNACVLRMVAGVGTCLIALESL